MNQKTLSIRPFIGSKDFNISRSFYKDLGFKETELAPNLSVFELNHLAFYLQDAYVKDWVDNTMLFLEIENANEYWSELQKLNLEAKYPAVKLLPLRELDWGKECFLHDPSGILWHIGEFKK